jgi:hypothetical protein
MTEELRFTRKEDFSEPKVLLWAKAVAIAWFGGDEDKAWEMILKEEAEKPSVKPMPKDDRNRLHLSAKKK